MIINAKSGKFVFLAVSVIFALASIFIFWDNDSGQAKSNLGTKHVGDNKDAVVATGFQETKTSKNLIKENIQTTDPQCSGLPAEIDPADDKLMALSRKCNPQNAQQEKKSPVLKPFQMPNLSWHEKVLTINGKKLTYRFGDGNPKEVALEPSAYNGSDGKYEDYVTPAVEQNLYQVLSDPALKNMADRCGMGINSSLSIDQTSTVLGSAQLSMENMLKIDEKTGRKYIDYASLMALNSIFTNLDSSLVENEHEKQKYQCLGGVDLSDFESLYIKFGHLMNSYINIDLSGAYSAGNPNNPDKADIEEYLRVTGKSQRK